MKRYVCTNFVECQAAQDKKEQEVPEGIPFKCEVCGSDAGTEVKKASGSDKKKILIAAAGLVVVAAVTVAIILSRSPGSESNQSDPITALASDSVPDDVTLGTQILEVTDSVSSIQAEIQRARDEKNSAKLTLLGQQMDSITKDFESKIKKLEKEKGSRSDQVVRLQNMLSKLQSKYDLLIQERDQALKELKETQEQLAVAKSENKELEQRNRESENSRARLQQEKEKAEREAEQALYRSEVEAYIEKGNSILEVAESSFKAGENLMAINYKKKKAAYKEALAKFEEAKKHFESPPPGKGGYTGDASLKARFQTGIKQAEAGIQKVSEKLD